MYFIFSGLLLLCSISLNASLAHQKTFSERAHELHERMEGIENVIEKALKDYQVPGIALGIVVGKDLLYAKGFGIRNLEQGLPVTEATLFSIGSCTKAFTAFVAGTLVDEGWLRWDEPIIHLVPDFRLKDEYTTQSITMRDLLAHRSGMPGHDLMWLNSSMNRKEVVRRLRYLDPVCCLRERFQYTNLMYLLAGYVMEEITHTTWETLVQERILTPLSMFDTNFSVQKMRSTSNFAEPYLLKKGQLKPMGERDISLIGPAGSMNSNVLDLSHWIQMQLQKGSFEHQTLMSAMTFQEMHTPQMLITGSPENEKSPVYAASLGWKIGSYRGHQLVSHDGGTEGYTSVTALLPQEGIGIVILSNRNLTPLPRLLSMEIVDRLLHLTREEDWLGKDLLATAAPLEEIEVEKKPNTAPTHPLMEYEGEYEHPGYGALSISCIGGNLQATFHGLTSYLKHWHYDVFVTDRESKDLMIPREGMKWHFGVGVEGDITQVSVPFEPLVAPIVFLKKKMPSFESISYLKRFEGYYEMFGYAAEIVLKGGHLEVVIPGQRTFSLIPRTENEFFIPEYSAIARFVLNDENVVEEVRLDLHYRTYVARPKRG